MVVLVSQGMWWSPAWQLVDAVADVGDDDHVEDREHHAGVQALWHPLQQDVWLDKESIVHAHPMAYTATVQPSGQGCLSERNLQHV